MRELLDIGWRRFGLAVEYRRDGYLVAADMLPKLGKGEASCLLLLEEYLACWGEVLIRFLGVSSVHTSSRGKAWCGAYIEGHGEWLGWFRVGVGGWLVAVCVE